MTLDQANTTTWQNAWTNLLNDVRQSFTPSLPKLVAVEVELVVGNPGASADTLMMKLMYPSGRPIVLTSKTVQTRSARYLSFRKVAYRSRPVSFTACNSPVAPRSDGNMLLAGTKRVPRRSMFGPSYAKPAAHFYSRHSARSRLSFLPSRSSFAASMEQEDELSI
jgi:hypothetical protein